LREVCLIGSVGLQPVLHRLLLPFRRFTEQVFHQQVIVDIVKLLFQGGGIID
jgi:hypothetical protein